MTFQIHKNVKLHPRTKYPFPQMKIGDVFYVPCEPDLRELTQSKVLNAARRFRTKHNPIFAVRTQSTEHEGQFAIVVLRTH